MSAGGKAKSKLKVDSIVIRIPSWAVKLYTGTAILLIPWTLYLGWSLPARHLSSHWDVSWTGLDIALIVSFLLTGIMAYVRSMWIVITASTTGSFLLVDAWFDILTEHSGPLFHQAVVTAVVLEIPLALTSFYIAGHALQRVKRHALKTNRR